MATSLPSPHEEHWLQVELLAIGSTLLQIDEGSSFEPLWARPKAVPLLQGSPFSEHITLPLPCDHGTRSSEAHPVAPGLVDTVHRFVLRPNLAQELNEELTDYALNKETLADIVLFEWSGREENMALKGSDWVDAWLKDGSKDSYDAGVRRTNVGGYQSHPDAFHDAKEGEDTEDVQWGCRQLHRICSEAVDALASQCCTSEDGDASPHRPGDLHSASAWINVNRGDSFNTMHIHDVGLWSAVYFVADGEAGEEREGEESTAEAGCASPSEEQAGNSPTTDQTSPRGRKGIGKHLILRGGAQQPCTTADEHSLVGTDKALANESKVPEGWLGLAEAPTGPASHCYLAVPPVPGTLWVFPGSVPHCVLGAKECKTDPLDRTEELDSGAERWERGARISVALNLTQAKVPPPHLPSSYA